METQTLSYPTSMNFLSLLTMSKSPVPGPPRRSGAPPDTCDPKERWRGMEFPPQKNFSPSLHPPPPKPVGDGGSDHEANFMSLACKNMMDSSVDGKEIIAKQNYIPQIRFWFAV